MYSTEMAISNCVASIYRHCPLFNPGKFGPAPRPVPPTRSNSFVEDILRGLFSDPRRGI